MTDFYFWTGYGDNVLVTFQERLTISHEKKKKKRAHYLSIGVAFYEEFPETYLKYVLNTL